MIETVWSNKICGINAMPLSKLTDEHYNNKIYYKTRVYLAL